jgi:hypothetical protein
MRFGGFAADDELAISERIASHEGDLFVPRPRGSSGSRSTLCELRDASEPLDRPDLLHRWRLVSEKPRADLRSKTIGPVRTSRRGPANLNESPFGGEPIEVPGYLRGRAVSRRT